MQLETLEQKKKQIKSVCQVHRVACNVSVCCCQKAQSKCEIYNTDNAN